MKKKPQHTPQKPTQSDIRFPHNEMNNFGSKRPVTTEKLKKNPLTDAHKVKSTMLYTGHFKKTIISMQVSRYVFCITQFLRNKSKKLEYNWTMSKGATRHLKSGTSLCFKLKETTMYVCIASNHTF